MQPLLVQFEQDLQLDSQPPNVAGFTPAPSPDQFIIDSGASRHVGDKCELQGKGPLQGFCLSTAKSPRGKYAVTGTPMLAPSASGPQAVMPAVCSAASPPAVSLQPRIATFLDDLTSLSVVVMLKQKSDVPDNGNEYFNSKLSSWCSSKGIRQEHSAPYSPEQNGRAGRLNRTLASRSKLDAKSQPGRLVGYEQGAKAYRVLVGTKALAGPRAEQWRQAMKEELAGLHANQTWTLVECPKGAKVLPCMWVLKAAAQDMELHQLDVQAAFLNRLLEPDEVIHMQQPQGFAEGGSKKVCRLQRALYGLCQAPHAWHTRLKQELEAMGFTVSQADPSLFTLVRPTGIVWLLVYVDDCLIGSSKGDSDSLSFVKQQLSAAFQVKHIGEQELFLGMQISRN
ncbi:retrovirus-related Pol poly from transposon TNT 1-94 [Haematococcus lacustris]|uniref:Retrovirus-related Pol poly from transposon TNT 1-94 n=1 Tax=Haematococcus lacustris TaxID=44745 RepID=A0A6A0AG83_HAELA|nr:retrovirus-related Pol poly from transposon TNT 1-94 [Haematococcus lacustris]